MKKKLRAFAAVIAACGLCISAGYLGSRAITKMPIINGRSTFSDFVYIQGDGEDAMSFENTDSFFSPYSYGDSVKANEVLLPGSSQTGEVDIENKSNQIIHLYLYAASTNDDTKFQAYANANSSFGHSDGEIAEKAATDTPYATDYSWDVLKKGSDLLTKKLNLKVDYTAADGSAAAVYQGPLSGTAAASGGHTMTEYRAIDLGEFEPGEKGKLNLTLDVPMDLKGSYSPGTEEANAGLTRGYNGTVAMIDWIFVAELQKQEPVSSDPVSSDPVSSDPVSSDPVNSGPDKPEPDKPKPKPTPDVPKTGEEAVPYMLAAAACAVGAIGMFVAAFRTNRDKKAEE